MIKPEPFEVNGKHFILSNFPAVEGREIILKYPTSALPKLGDYEENQKTMFKIMKYVAVDINGSLQCLVTPELVNNHCVDAETLLAIELKMMEKNYAFFRDGRGLNFFDRLVQMCLSKASEMLTTSLEQSYPAAKQPSTN